MECPTCHDPMLIVECDHVELDVCFHGHGVWFDADELRQLFELAGAEAGLSRLEDRLTHLPSTKEKKKRCPRCRAKMLHFDAPAAWGSVVLDRCPGGHGLWFDEGELHDVLTAELGEGDGTLATIKKYLGSFCEPRKEATDS